MKDRFRFRVWNIKEKEMIYNAEIAYDGMNYNTDWQLGDNQNDGWVDCFGYYLDYEHQDYEIMQCTGLKDKNGILIYEGDILKSSAILDGLKPVYNVVKWHHHCWIANGTLTEFILEISEVVGNIYENKELLES